jgi:hypothetical protein
MVTHSFSLSPKSVAHFLPSVPTHFLPFLVLHSSHWKESRPGKGGGPADPHLNLNCFGYYQKPKHQTAASGQKAFNFNLIKIKSDQLAT